MNWSNLEFIGFQTNHKTGKKYYQQYLKPCYYLELRLRWTSNDDLLMLYNSIIEEIGHLFTYHHNSNKSSDSKIKDKEKAFNILPDFLASKRKYLWQELSNNGGVGAGCDDKTGGASDASLSFWIHKTPYSEAAKKQQVENYKESLMEYKTDMLPFGLRISNVHICFPVDHFKGEEDFFNWVLNNEFIKKGAFFSGSAGYRINSWEGYVNKEATEKLAQILTDFPGLDYNASGVYPGRVLNEDKSDFLPLIKRLNWLTFISEEGVQELEGVEKLKAEIEKNNISRLHQLESGVCIRACEKPALSEKDADFKQFYAIQKIVNKLRYRSHLRDSFLQSHKEVGLQWMYKFEGKTPM